MAGPRALRTAPSHSVTAVGDDGSLQLKSTRTGRTVGMAADYVATDAALYYASTAHGAQDITVDTCHLVLTAATDRATAYVCLTRGGRRAGHPKGHRPGREAPGARPASAGP